MAYDSLLPVSSGNLSTHVCRCAKIKTVVVYDSCDSMSSHEVVCYRDLTGSLLINLRFSWLTYLTLTAICYICCYVGFLKKASLLSFYMVFMDLLKSGFSACVSGTHNGARCLPMYRHHCSQAIPSFAIRPCMLATKSHMLNFCETCAAICCDLSKLITQDTRKFSVLRKKEQSSKQNNMATTFGKSLFLTHY